jgi:hypothetical protein
LIIQVLINKFKQIMSYGEEIIDYMVDYTPSSELYGDMDVIQENYTVGGFESADYYGEINDDAGVWRPDSDGKFPLISFSHGFGMGDEGVWGHSHLLNDVASQGYVIVAHKSAGYSGMGDYSGDQLRVMEWAMDSEISEFIDWEAPTTVMGYSMGGGATLNSGANVEAVDMYNIGVAVAIAPMTEEVMIEGAEAAEAAGMPPVELWAVNSPVTPVMFAVGEADMAARPEAISVNYEACENAKVWLNLAAANHLEITMAEQRWSYAVSNMVNCHIKGDETACAVIYNVDAALEDSEDVCQVCDCPEQLELVECFVNGATALASSFVAINLITLM